MDEKTERRMHRLLARGRLSRPELEVIRESVLDAVKREKKAKRPARVYQLWAGTALAAAAALLLVVFVPREQGGGGGDVTYEDGELGSRVALEVRCSAGTLSACPASASIVFVVRAAGKGRAVGFVSAYAEPVSGGGERVFYLSKEDGSAELAMPAGTAGSERAVKLTGAQRPGRYRVHVFFAGRPLGREEMVAGAREARVAATARVELVIAD